jgi:hypothetical protein
MLLIFLATRLNFATLLVGKSFLFYHSPFPVLASRSKNIFVWLWMAALLSATIGLSVQQIYCYCVGQTRVALFHAEDACMAGHAGEAEASCCAPKAKAPEKSCCQKPAPGAPERKSGCTHKTTHFFQLRTEALAADSPELPHFEAALDLPLPLSLPALSVFLNPGEAFLPAVAPQPPPPLPGRLRCIRHQVQRC